MSDEDFEGEAPSEGPTDLSSFDDDNPLAAVPMGDDEALKGMRRRTSTAGRVGGVVIVIMLGVVAWFGYRATIAKDQQMAAVEACGELDEQEAMLACLREQFEQDDHPDVRVRIIQNLDHFEDAAAVPLYITGLDQKGEVRRQSAIALANLGSPTADPARQKLLDVLPDTDELDRTQVVWALAVLGETNAADAIIEQFVAGRLQDMPGWNPAIITNVLGAERLASDELLNHEEESVRLLTAQALAESGDPAAIDPLSRLVDHELARPEDQRNTEVIRSAATGLGRTGDPRAAAPLFRLLENEPNMTDGIIAALGKSIAGSDLANLVNEAEDVGIKRELVRLVAASHDPDTADALAALIDHDDEEIRNDSAIALAKLGDPRAVPRLIAMAQSDNEAAADAALDGLELLGPADAATDLLALLPPQCPDEPDPTMPAGCFRQAAIIRALGATGTDAAARRIEKALTGVDAPAAAQALATMNYNPAFNRLLAMVERPADVDMTATNAAERSIPNEDLLRTRKGAILAMKIYARPEAVEDLMKIVEDPMDDYELRAYAAHAIGRSATPDQLQEVIRKVQDESLDEAARRYYVQALWQKPQPSLNAELIGLMGNADAPVAVRRAAAIAVGYGADAQADQGLMALLDNDEGRRVAAFSIALGGSEEAARALVAALGEDTDAEEILQFAMMDEQSEWFDVLTEEMFESGAVWRRIEAAKILREGDRQGRYAYAWLKTVQVLQSGWEGPGGATPQFVRMQMYGALTGDDADRRATAAEILGAMGETGLLLKARDSGGPGAQEARNVLQAATNPAS